MKHLLIWIIFFTAVLYAGTLTHGFVWDDHSFIEEWPETRSIKNIGKIFTGSYPTWHSGKYRPVKGMILTADYALFKTDSLMYHVQAVGIYIVIILLLYFILRTLTQNNKLAFLATFIFSVHPAHVEAITFVTSSIDMVGMIFLLLSLLTYIYSRQNGESQKAYVFISLVSGFLAMLTYEATLILPMLIGLVEIVHIFSLSDPDNLKNIMKSGESKSFQKESLRQAQAKKIWSIIKKSLPYFFLALLYLGLRHFFLKIPSDTPYIENSFWFTVLTMTKVFVRYIELFFLPLKLTIEHLIAPGISSQIEVSYVKDAMRGQTIFDPLTILGIGIFFILLSTFWLRKRMPWIFFGSWFTLIGLLPFSFIVPLPTLLTERYLFLASIGLSIISADIFLKAFYVVKNKSGSIILFILLASWLTFFSYKTFTRNLDWKDDVVFWAAEAKTTPESVVIRHNLGVALKSQKKLDDAELHLVWAAEHNTACQPRIFQSLGNLYVEKKQWESAMDQFVRALLCDKNNYQSFYYLGRMYEAQEDFINAEKTYSDAISISPEGKEARLALGIVLVKQKKYSEAEAAFLETINIDPREMAAYTNLIFLYKEIGEMEKLKNMLAKALIQFPNSIEIQSLKMQIL